MADALAFAAERARTHSDALVRLGLAERGYLLVTMHRAENTDDPARRLGVPCVTLREDTEWVETVLAGWNVLAGTDAARIVQMVQTFACPDTRMPLYGDGQAATRVVETMKGDLGGGVPTGRLEGAT